jgi:hypothetical protein
LNLERAEKMIKYGEYDSLDDKIERMAKAIEGSDKKHKSMFKKLFENPVGDKK